MGKLRLMGTAEVAELLGISRQWADVVTSRRDFPEPVAVLKAGRIWLAEDVEQYDRERRAGDDQG
jgi:prophage regulatory protein